MSDKLAGGIKAGSTSVSLPVELRKSEDSTELAGKAHGDVTASFWRQGEARSAIAMAMPGSVDAAWLSGGFVEVDAVNMPGIYRFDVPDAAFAPGADFVIITCKVAEAFVQSFLFALESSGAADLRDELQSIIAKLINARVTLPPPVSVDGLSIRLVRGNDYLALDGRALEFTSEDWPDLTGAAVVLKIGATANFPATLLGERSVRVELTDLQTTAIVAGSYHHQLVATLANGDTITLLRGGTTTAVD